MCQSQKAILFIRVEINTYGVFKFKKKTNTTVPGVRIVVYSVARGKVRPEGTYYFPFGHRGGRHVRDR